MSPALRRLTQEDHYEFDDSQGLQCVTLFQRKKGKNGETESSQHGRPTVCPAGPGQLLEQGKELGHLLGDQHTHLCSAPNGQVSPEK